VGDSIRRAAEREACVDMGATPAKGGKRRPRITDLEGAIREKVVGPV
jgi:hypothetical protein